MKKIVTLLIVRINLFKAASKEGRLLLYILKHNNIIDF